MKPRRPKLGEIKQGKAIAGRSGRTWYEWHACIQCGHARWVQHYALRKGKNTRCKKCSMENQSKRQSGNRSRFWKGGKVVTPHGYVHVRIPKGHRFYSMCDKNGYIREHRLVMAEYLGRLLTKGEIVHHKNGIKDDNKIENLEVKGWGEHAIEHSMGYEDGFQIGFRDARLYVAKQLLKLRKENAQLKSAIAGYKSH